VFSDAAPRRKWFSGCSVFRQLNARHQPPPPDVGHVPKSAERLQQPL